MSAEEDDDRQHEPTEQKLRRARDKGDIPRSTEIGGALSYLGFVLLLTMFAGAAFQAWSGMAARLLGAEPWPARGVFDMAWGLASRSSAWLIGGLTVPAMLVLAGYGLQRSLSFTPDRLVPKLSKINPLHNAKQKFGRTGLTSFAMSLLRVLLVTLGGWMLFSRLIGRIAAAGATQGGRWTEGIVLILHDVLILALEIAVVFALADYALKWFDHRRRNRMTRREMQDEYKESEGDPHLRHARRQRAVDIAMNTMLADVEKADVVIVNPTHYAIALEWKRGSGRAPVCVAKGVDDVAGRIRERAREHGVPIWSDPPCARALFATVKLGEEIERDYFGPVAAAIRFAEAMRAKARKGWGAAIPSKPKARR